MITQSHGKTQNLDLKVYGQKKQLQRISAMKTWYLMEPEITRGAGAIGGDNDIMPQRNKGGRVHIVNTFDSAPCVCTIHILA